MTREKNWSFNEAIWTVNGDDQALRGKKFFLMLKSRLVTYGGWRVIGSCDAVDYEYEGATAGSSYGGESTSPYDRWEGTGDLVRQSSEGGSNISWCVLRGPASDKGVPYFAMAFVGNTDSKGTFYWYPSKPALGSNPLNRLPRPVPFVGVGHSLTEAWVYTADVNENQRAYLSACPNDGSFVLTTSATNQAQYTGLMMFHMLAQDDALNTGWEFPVVSYLNTKATKWVWYTDTYKFSCIHPDVSQNIQVAAICAPFYGASTRVLLTMTGLDTVDSKMAAFPAYLFCVGGAANASGEGIGAIVGRMEDVFVCPESLVNGDTGTTGTAVEYYVFDGLMWLPADSAPEFGP